LYAHLSVKTDLFDLSKKVIMMKMYDEFSPISVLIISLFIILSGTEIPAQTDFTHVTNKPVLSYGSPGKWDSGTVWNPTVIKDGDTLRMWYTGMDAIVWDYHPGSIGYAWSVSGTQWFRFSGNPVLSAELDWEVSSLFGCAVIKEDNLFKMWYGAAGTPSEIIGYATSEDGKNWTKYSDPVLEPGPGNDWDLQIVIPQSVIKEGETYKMWYWGGRKGFPQESAIPQTGLATSPDGINWTKYDDPSTTENPLSRSDPVLKVGEEGEWDSNRIIDPMVLPTATGYEMWYLGVKPPINPSTPQYIGYATSADGIHWTKWPENPILKQYPAWGFGFYGGTVLRFNNKYHLWFSCFHASQKQAAPQIGYATSPAPPTAVELQEARDAIPAQYQLFQNTPNPFNPSTTIRFDLPEPGEVTLKVFTLLGKEVETLISKNLAAGEHHVLWNAGSQPSGVYLIRLEAGGFVQTRKMVLMK
jgi:predicted GH43/DUF377 family glycosyl hydrolase